MEQTRDRAWRNAERIKRLSDNMIRVGPWAMMGCWPRRPSRVRSTSRAAARLLREAVRPRPSAWTLTGMAAYMIVNSAMSDVPVIGWAMDTQFRGQAMAANAL
jgi:hypothetical protein